MQSKDAISVYTILLKSCIVAGLYDSNPGRLFYLCNPLYDIYYFIRMLGLLV